MHGWQWRGGAKRSPSAESHCLLPLVGLLHCTLPSTEACSLSQIHRAVQVLRLLLTVCAAEPGCEGDCQPPCLHVMPTHDQTQLPQDSHHRMLGHTARNNFPTSRQEFCEAHRTWQRRCCCTTRERCSCLSPLHVLNPCSPVLSRCLLLAVRALCDCSRARPLHQKTAKVAICRQ